MSEKINPLEIIRNPKVLASIVFAGALAFISGDVSAEGIDLSGSAEVANNETTPIGESLSEGAFARASATVSGSAGEIDWFGTTVAGGPIGGTLTQADLIAGISHDGFGATGLMFGNPEGDLAGAFSVWGEAGNFVGSVTADTSGNLMFLAEGHTDVIPLGQNFEAQINALVGAYDGSPLAGAGFEVRHPQTGLFGRVDTFVPEGGTDDTTLRVGVRREF